MTVDLLALRDEAARARLRRLADHTAYILGEDARLVCELRDVVDELGEVARLRLNNRGSGDGRPCPHGE